MIISTSLCIYIYTNFDIASFFLLIRSISRGWLKSDQNSYRLAPTVCYRQFLAQWACHVPLKAEIVSNLCIRSYAANWLSVFDIDFYREFRVFVAEIFAPSGCSIQWTLWKSLTFWKFQATGVVEVMDEHGWARTPYRHVISPRDSKLVKLKSYWKTMPIQISDLLALTSRQKNALRLKIVHLKCDEHFSHFWPIRFGRIPKWNFGKILVAHPIHLTLRGPMMTQASQELIKSFGDKDSFMNGLLGCLLLGQVEVIPDHPPDQSWNVVDHVTVIGFVLFPKISKSMLFLCGLGGFHISSVAWIWPSRSIWAADWSLLPSSCRPL